MYEEFYLELLSILLNCDMVDISIIEDTEYPIYDIVQRAEEFYGEITLETIVAVIIEKGIYDFEEAVFDRIRDIEIEYENFSELMNGMNDSEYENYITNLRNTQKINDDQFFEMQELLHSYRELEALKNLDVPQDITYKFNYLETSVYFINNEELYREYCDDMIDDFETNTGFSI